MAEANKKKLKKLKASIDTKLSSFTVEDILEESIVTYKQDQAKQVLNNSMQNWLMPKAFQKRRISVPLKKNFYMEV